MKFDVNRVLTDLQANVQEALRVSYQPEANEVAEGLLLEIAEDFDNLDAHLQRAGSLPEAWKR